MRLVKRNLFYTLWHCPVENKYYVLNDLNYVNSFRANNDEDAIAVLGWNRGVLC